MSQRNGDKSRFQINRKRAVLRRERARQLMTAGKAPETVGTGKRRIKPPTGR
jgi:hypothetical protein